MPDTDTTGAFRLDRGSRVLLVGGAPVSLGARAFDVLAHLDAHSRPGGVEGRASGTGLGRAGRGGRQPHRPDQRAAQGAGPKAIATVPGVGYKLAIGTTTETPPTGPALPDKPSLAVLPFANLTGRAEQDYFVEGLVSELIAALSRVPALFVIAGGSTFALRGQSVDLTDVGRQLGVDICSTARSSKQGINCGSPSM
jgi:DNA-binding winged helix-turn-helix (wHTH) protein